MNPLVNYFRNLQEIHSSQAAEAQLFVGWVSALRNPCARWVSCFNPTYVLGSHFYGLFSAWVLWHKENLNREDKFDWKSAAHHLQVPMLAILFEQIAAPSKLKSLGLVEVLNWTGAALNRVRREEFFRQFDEGQAVQYFYEPFLQAFDPDLRKELGVWYTPPSSVLRGS